MIDAHIHFSEDLGAENLLKVIERYGYEAIALPCFPKGLERPSEPDAFAFRSLCASLRVPVNVYIFGGMDYSAYSLPEEELSRALVRRVEELTDLGCTGIKLLEGKPNVRKMIPVPDFDKPVFEPFWTALEKNGIPVIFHVNDPEEFWDISLCPSPEEREFRIRSGWVYDSSYVNNEEQYRQVIEVAKRHPGLRILFPHFFFLSRQLLRFAGILDACPNIMTDMTPGVELYLNLSDNVEEARAFFQKYQDRICYGTDIGSRQVYVREPVSLNMEETAARVSLVTGFLNSKEEYTLRPDAYYRGPEEKRMHPLCLPETVQRKIYRENFLRFIGDRSV